MPAVQLARVKIQVGQLMTYFAQPAAFVRRLNDLLDFYADRTYRPGRNASHLPMLPHYLVPAPVLRQLEADLTRETGINPSAALPLVDALWADGHYETRLLAVHLLGRIHPAPPEPIIDRIIAWAKPSEEPAVMDRLLTSGHTLLQAERPDLWLELIRTWLADSDPVIQAIGLRALLSVVKDPGFQNLPSIFTLLTPLMQSIPATLHPEMADIIQVMAGLSPTETAYFLRTSLGAASLHTIKNLSRLVRRCLPFFDESIQARLRGVLSERFKA